MNAGSQVTVVFCTLSRYPLLSAAVNSLINTDDFKSEICEIIIVDNTPESQRKPIPDVPDNVKVIYCQELGLSNARNLAIETATYDVVVFLDDDVIVKSGWLTGLLAGIAQFPDALIFGGKTIPHFEVGVRPVWYYDHLSSYQSCIDWGLKPRPIDIGEWLVGANIAFKKEVFVRFGMFDPGLGRRGHGTLLSNEEIEIIRRVGHQNVFYLPEMLVEHRINPERMEIEWFRKRITWQAVSDEIVRGSYLDLSQAKNVFRKHILNCPAEYRSLNSLTYIPDSPQACRSQFDAIYAYTVMLLNGYSD